MRIFILFCTSFVVLVCNAQIRTPRPEISLQNYNEVNASRPVLLKDLATFNFTSVSNIRQAMNISIAEPLAEGERVELKNSDLVKLIKEKITELVDIADLKWTYFVPEKVVLVGRKNLISEIAVQSELTQALQEKCGDCKVVFKDLKIPRIREKQAFESCSLEAEQMRSGSFLMPINCQFQAERKTYWITGTAKTYKMGPIATRQIQAGQKISLQDVRLEQVDLTYAKDSLPSISEIQNQIAARGLQVNQPIFFSDLKKEIAVLRGQLIRAISGNESFEVSSQVLAEEQGYVGDLIKVKNPETQRLLSAQIIEKGLVKVQ